MYPLIPTCSQLNIGSSNLLRNHGMLGLVQHVNSDPLTILSRNSFTIDITHKIRRRRCRTTTVT